MYELGGKFMQWLVQWTTGHAVQVLALAGVISSWATQFTLIFPPSQMYNWVLVNLILG